MKKILVLCLLLPGCNIFKTVHSTTPAPIGTQIFIIAGQSNAVGFGKEGVVEDNISRQVMMLTQDRQWSMAHEPLHAQSSQEHVTASVSQSMGVPFAHELMRLWPGVKVGLVPCAQSGTALSLWDELGGSDTLLGNCIERAKKAVELSGDGHIAGILWYQGEADACGGNRQADSVTYGSRLGQFISLFRSAVNAPAAFFFVMKLHTMEPLGSNCEPWATDVRRGQETAAHGSVILIPTEDLPLTPNDGAHLSSQAQALLGQRIARSFWSYLTGN